MAEPEPEELIQMGMKNLPETTNMEPPQSSSSGQDKQLENTVPSVSTDDGGDSTLQQQSPVHTYEQYVEIAMQQVSDFMLETSKSPEIEEPQLDNSEDQQKTSQEDDKFATEISEPELLDCLVHKLEEIISSQEDKKQDNATVPEKLQLQFDKPNNNTHNLSTLSRDLFLSDSSQESHVEQAVNLESDIVISNVSSLGKTPMKAADNEIEIEEEIWNDDSMQELQELEELGYSAVVPTQPTTQDSETSEEAGPDNQTTSLSCGNQILSSQESCDLIKLNVKICSMPLESLKPLFHESNDMMLSEQSVTEKSPQLFTSNSSQDSQFENDEAASQTCTENIIIISNICSLSKTNVVNTTKIDDKNISQDSFEEILDGDFAKQLQELEEFGYEVVAPIQSEIDGENKSYDRDNSQPPQDDISSKNKIHGSALDVTQDIKMQQTDVDTNTMTQDGGDQVVDGSINISINTQEKSFEPLLSSQEINTQTINTGSQDSCATASGETQSSKSSSKKGSSSKISDIIDEFLDSYADEIIVDDMDHVDMDDDCDLIPPQLADNSTSSSSNLTKMSSKLPLHSNEKSSQCQEDQICFSNSKYDKELKATADLLIGKQPFCSEIKIAIPKEAIATEASLPNPCSTISSYSTDTATLPEQSSSASMPTESLTASNTTLSNEEGKVSSKKTRSMFIQTDATPVDTMATQTENIVGSDMSTQTSLTMQHLNNTFFTEIPGQIYEEENKPQNKIRTRSTASKEWVENTDPETNSSQGSNEGLSTNKRAKRKCTQEENLSDFKLYPRTRKHLSPFSLNDQKIATICNESSAKNYMEKGNKKILSDDKSVKNTAQKILFGERKIFKERIATSVGGKASELPRCKERRVGSQIQTHTSDSSSPGSSSKNSPISSPMIYQKKDSPDSSDSTSSPEQKARKGKKSQEQVMQAGYSSGSSSPPEAKKKKLSQGECSMRLRSEPQQEPARKGLRLGLSRCAKLKTLLKKQ